MKTIRKWNDLEEFKGRIVAFTHPNSKELNINHYHKQNSDLDFYYGFVTTDPHQWNKQEGFELDLLYYKNAEVIDHIYLTDEYLQQNNHDLQVRLPYRDELSVIKNELDQGHIEFWYNDDRGIDFVSWQLNEGWVFDQ
jgi:hypothetical protein